MANQSTAAKQTEEHLEPLESQEEEELRRELDEMVQVFGGGLQTKFDQQVGLKEEIEQRWLDDLRHYNGVYDKATEVEINATDKEKASKIFVNLTRSKCNTAESKWSDLVLPTDDRNWGLKPTPVPELVDGLKDASPVSLLDGTPVVDPDTGEAYQQKDVAEASMNEATDRARKMETEMDDQLVEAKYNATCRDIIHDSVVMGTGIIKGPMVERRTKRAWVEGEGGWQMAMKEETKPTAERVDPWNFFPDMSATRWEDCEFVFERHLLIRKDLRNLARQPGFMPEQIKKVLDSAPNANHAKLNYLNELREISGITSIQQDNRYEVLEYHGPIDKKDLIACGCDVDLENSLDEFEGIVWLCMGIVIKVALNHMDSEELPYNVLNWEKDDTNTFGFGVPYRMRDPQKVMNASWRMVLDNAGLSTGPQILINKTIIEPADGIWELSPRKIWWMESKDPKMRADYAMQTFNIDNNQQELTAIFEMAHRLADEETSVPQMQMGNVGGDTQQPAMLKTLGGTALWMSSQNVMMRRAVKNFDDDITVPFLTRVYDWNMQFNQKNEIKGDFNIDARGTSVLLVREMQARNILEFINAAMVIPGGMEELETRGVMKNMAKGMQIAVSDVMRTDDDAEVAEQEQKDNPPMDPEVQKMQMQIKMKEMEINWKREETHINGQIKMAVVEGERQTALINREVELTKTAADSQVKLEDIRQKAGIEKYKTDWNIKAFYEELAEKRREGQTANYGLEAED